MSIPQYRVSFDTSAYIAALYSSTGAARELLRLVEVQAIRMVVSEEVVIEVDKVIDQKFPDLLQESRELWKSLEPEIAPTPNDKHLKPFLKKLHKSDASILCASQLAEVVAFVTWNTRDFFARGVDLLVDFPIIIPADGLKLYRKWIQPFID